MFKEGRKAPNIICGECTLICEVQDWLNKGESAPAPKIDTILGAG